MITRCVSTIYLGVACAFAMHVLILNSREAPCSLSCCLLELSWFKQLSRGRQTKRSCKAEKGALGAGQYAISEKQGEWTLARKEKVWIKPKHFLALWRFVFCMLLGHSHLPLIDAGASAPVRSNITWSIFSCGRLAHVWRCAVLVVRVRRLAFSEHGLASRLSHQPEQSLDSSDVRHCTVSWVQASQAL